MRAKLLLAGLIALPMVILLTLPARIVTAPFDLPDAVGTVHGTVWNGTTSWQQPGFAPMAVNWNWSPPASWQWQATDGESRLSGYLQPHGLGIVLTALRGELALARVDIDRWLPDTRPRGRLHVDIARMRLGGREPPVIDGRVLWLDASLIGAVEAQLGTIELFLESGNREQAAQFRSLEAGEVEVNGEILLTGGRYELHARLTPLSGDPELARQLAWLGRPEDDGAVHIRFNGHTGW